MKIIDLSQTIYAGMPVFSGHPEVEIEVWDSHEGRSGIANPPNLSPTVHRMVLGEHTGSHVDAFNHFSAELRDQGIDTMPLAMFITSAFCLNVSHRGLLEPITRADIETALNRAGMHIEAGDTILLYTNHYRRHYGTENWPNGPGVTEDVARWFGSLQIAGFGVETRSPGVRNLSNKGVHEICGELRFTHYENLINLHQLVGIGRFQFIGLPLKIRGGTGSPIRAVAILP